MIIAILGRKISTFIVLAMRALTLEELQSVARQRGGECLSESYTNLLTSYRFRCVEGHEFETRAQGVVQGGTW